MSRILLKCLLPVICAIFIVACNQAAPKKKLENTKPVVKPNVAGGCAPEANADLKIKLDLIQQLMDKGSLFAALAHLDALRSNDPQAMYLRAEILRRTDRSDQAIPIYQSLIASCKAGKGYHGLGLIAGRNDKLSVALDYLQKAAYELPLDVRVRNDYGYALLLNKQYELARNEFMTAYELSGGDQLATTNMTLLMFVTEKEDEVQNFVERMGLDENTVQQLQEQAEKIKSANELPSSEP